MNKNLVRIGIHLSTAGGVYMAAERAQAIGANTFQIFSSSPRMWRPSHIEPAHCERMRELREKYGCSPLVIHTNYLVNLCSQSEEVRSKSSLHFTAKWNALSPWARNIWYCIPAHGAG